MANKQSSKDLKGIRRRLDKFMDDSLHYQVEICVPKTLRKSFLLEHTPVGIAESRWVAFAYYIISRVVLLTLNKDFKRSKTGGSKARKWVSLPITAFRDVGASKYVAMRKHLLDISLIECDDDYSYTNGETYGYRLGKDFRKQPIKFRTIKDAAVNTVLIELRRKEVEQTKPLLREIAYVAKGWLHPELIELDKEAALDFLGLYRSVMHRRLEKRLSRTHDSAEVKDELRMQVENRYVHARRQVKKWGKRTRLSVDSKGGRFYTPLVSLLSPLRNFVTFNGQQLISFDLKNSQPLHLLLLLDKEFWTADSRLSWSLRKLDKNLWEEVWAHPLGSAQEAATSLSIELNKSRRHTDDERVAKSHFAKLVLDGNLYEVNSERFRGKYRTQQGKDRFGTRELAKGEMLKLMYFDNKNPYSDSQKPFEEFRKWYPLEAKVMDVLKSRDYRDFSVLLQKLEAKILLHKVCRNIYEQNTTAWFTTIHDSIVTTADQANLVENVILTTYSKLLGVAPQLKRTNMHPDASFDELGTYVNTKLDKELGAEEIKLLHTSIQDIKVRLRARDTAQELLTDEFPFALPTFGVGLEQDVPNPFESPRRKLKK
jgi:hypothetical protein